MCVLEVNGRRTSPPVSDDKEEGVIGHHLRVQHQGPGQSDHSYKQREEEGMIKCGVSVGMEGSAARGAMKCHHLCGCGRLLKGEV